MVHINLRLGGLLGVFLGRIAVYNMMRKMSFLTQDFASSCFVQGGARTTLVITAPQPSWLGLEWGFAECADRFGRHFPTFCANRCIKQTRGTQLWWSDCLSWGLHINLCSPSNHWPSSNLGLGSLLGVYSGMSLNGSCSKTPALSCQPPTLSCPLESVGI